jgi:hypothetical protein
MYVVLHGVVYEESKKSTEQKNSVVPTSHPEKLDFA